MPLGQAIGYPERATGTRRLKNKWNIVPGVKAKRRIHIKIIRKLFCCDLSLNCIYIFLVIVQFI